MMAGRPVGVVVVFPGTACHTTIISISTATNPTTDGRTDRQTIYRSFKRSFVSSFLPSSYRSLNRFPLTAPHRPINQVVITRPAIQINAAELGQLSSSSITWPRPRTAGRPNASGRKSFKCTCVLLYVHMSVSQSISQISKASKGGDQSQVMAGWLGDRSIQCDIW